MDYNAKYDFFEICVVAILSNEDSEIFYEFYSHPKNVYNFCPKKFTYDFALGNINSLKKFLVMNNINLYLAFFI